MFEKSLLQCLVAGATFFFRRMRRTIQKQQHKTKETNTGTKTPLSLSLTQPKACRETPYTVFDQPDCRETPYTVFDQPDSIERPLTQSLISQTPLRDPLHSL